MLKRHYSFQKLLSFLSAKGSFLFLFCFLISVYPSIGAEKGEGKTRILGPGVMRSIRPFVNYSDTYQWSAMPEIVGQSNTFDWARDLFYTREIWCLEFRFKPVRMINVDFPTEKGTMQRHEVWYLVYSVTNTGKCLKNEVEVPANNKVNVMVESSAGQFEAKSFEEKKNNLEGTYKPAEVDYNEAQKDSSGKTPGTVHFVPQFVLVSNTIQDRLKYRKDDNGYLRNLPAGKEEAIYFDQFLPMAFVKIAVREDAERKFQNSITFPTVDIKPGETYWGIATWVDIDRTADDKKMKSVDPRIDRFSIYISGLTNALRWEDTPSSYNPKAKFLEGRTIFRKVLKLNFYRPSDEFDENSEEIRFGQPGELDYQWIYL
ncbi:MAG: hypothetical protein Q4G69_06580 [Planctomycetia bacterium]|nr:hypothetical protein [Planctomycetia bacterium]